MSIPMSLTLGLSGQPFNGPDIGGFADVATPELLAQWMALGAYYPFSRNHADKNANQQEPWALGKKVENVSRVALNRRYRLLPFLYTLFQEASVNGLPVMRPMFMADPKDKSLRSEQQAFLWGDDLAIIPSWAKNTALPKGNWKTLKLDETPDDDKYQATLKIREGAVIPTGRVIQNTTEYSLDSLTFYINVDEHKQATGKLYNDDGNGFGYRKGEYAIYELKASSVKNNSIELHVKQSEGDKKYKMLYRAALVKEGKINYSEWTTSNKVIVVFE
jgi:alpha-glucosidase